MKKFTKVLKNQKGLTLIELLAVIVILAIVAAIAVPSIGGIIENSRVGAIKADGITALNAANLYFADTETSEVSASTTVTVETLVQRGFLETNASLTNATSVKKISGGNEITGSGSGSGVTVTFTNASSTEINAYKNSDRGTVTGKDGVSAGKTTTP